MVNMKMMMMKRTLLHVSSHSLTHQPGFSFCFSWSFSSEKCVKHEALSNTQHIFLYHVKIRNIDNSKHVAQWFPSKYNLSSHSMNRLHSLETHFSEQLIYNSLFFHSLRVSWLKNKCIFIKVRFETIHVSNMKDAKAKYCSREAT